MPRPPFWLTGLLGFAFLLQLLLFLRMPIADGMVHEDGTSVRRGELLLSYVLYPEGIIQSWFGGNQFETSLLDRIPLLLASVAYLTLATYLGMPLARFADCNNRLRSIERTSIACLVGLSCLSTITFLVGLAGGLQTRWTLIVAVTGFCMARAWFARINPVLCGILKDIVVSNPLTQRTEICASEDGPSSLMSRLLNILVVAATIGLAVVYLLGGAMPPNEFDVLEYHLQMPREFYSQGVIRFVPHNIYGNMPLATEMHSLAAMTVIGQANGWWGALIGKLVSSEITLVGALLLGGLMSRMFSRWIGWASAAMWLAAPGNASVAFAGLIDSVLATYVLASAYAVEQAISKYSSKNAMPLGSSPDANSQHEGMEERSSLGWWMVAGVCSGTAAACKYPGLLYAVVPVIAYWIVLRVCYGTAWVNWRSLVACCAMWCGTFLPWYAKNWVFAGNPVYPLAASWFGGTTLTEAKIQQWQLAHRVPGLSLKDHTFVEVFVNQSTALWEAMKGIALTGPQLHPALAGLLLIGTLVVCRGSRMRFGKETKDEASLRTSPEVSRALFVRWLLWSLWIVSVWWFATHRIDRFWLPVLGLWAALASIGLAWIRCCATSYLSSGIALLSFGYGLVMCSAGVVGDNRFFVSLNALHTDYGDAARGIPGRVPRAPAWMNTHLNGKDVRALLIGEAAVFHYEIPICYSTCFDRNPGEDWLREKAPQQQAESLRNAGITHVLVNWKEISRYRSPGNYGFSEWPQPEDLQRMVDSGVLGRVDEFPGRGEQELFVVRSLENRAAIP